MPPNVDSVYTNLDMFNTCNGLLKYNGHVIYTVGYEGKSIDDFINILKKEHIDVLIDVREYPLSRKKGFSKTALSNYLESNGIKYIHMKLLGSPKPLRDRLKSKSISFKEFATQYIKYVRTQDETLSILEDYASSHKCVLMCYEKDWEVCHRNLIANILCSRGFGVIHI
ncbi:DUF488 domain-containing protein [Methanothermococcus thermolithotrophicus]|uniref:DUF488 domain-containing protein n=1 Tax=Methanothermococcus thermolithotrophicus TaxID=2186 RepID=UPI00037C2964|nr:DUF488 domain-containing protein [Methanothermococcus thermolithotrophicus]